MPRPRRKQPTIIPPGQMTPSQIERKFGREPLDIDSYQLVRIVSEDQQGKSRRRRKSPLSLLVLWVHDNEGGIQPILFQHSEREILHLGKQIVYALGNDRERDWAEGQ